MMKYLLILVFLVADVALAGTCQKTTSSCIDTTPCKAISGVQVCLTGATIPSGGISAGIDCWKYQDTYKCLEPNAVDYCQPFSSLQPQCWQTNSTCAQTDTTFNTGCMKYQQTWRCNDANLATPANTVVLDDTYTLVSSGYDAGQCLGVADNPNCAIAESKCTSTTPPVLPVGISATDVAPDGCYEKVETYACTTGATNNSECDGYANNADCTVQSSYCDPEDKAGKICLMEQQTYQCMSVPPKTTTVTDCSGQLYCQGGGCFDQGYPNDSEFARSMALMEAAREAGTYGSEISIFSGTDSRCRIKIFGLVNCCKKSSGGGGFSNNNLFGAAITIGGQAIDVGSAYVYDALYDAPTLQQGLGAMLGVTGADGLFNPSFSFYGFSFQFLPTQGFVFTGFDPTSLAIQIGLMILQDLLSCEQSEQILAMKRGQRLCHEVGGYCSSKIPIIGTCIEKTKSHCCYNSRLARIINEQGRGQIGKSWGSAKSPNCSGFTPAEFAAIDFSNIDMSEFTAEIMANIKMPNVGSMSQQINTSVQQKLQNYYQR